VALSGVCILLAYWKIRKPVFQKTTYDLALTFLLPVSVLLLTNKVVCEQFFVWLVPFIIILCIGGRIKISFFWAISLVALLYATINCPIPFFFLPIAPEITDGLLYVANFSLSFEPLRITILALLGCIFSIILVLSLRQASRKNDGGSSLH
jgi:hypothetical protein